MCIWLLIPEQKRVNAYNTTDTDTHMSAYYYWKGYWCWHFQRKMLLLFYCFFFGFTFCVPENIIAEIFLPSNLFSIQRTNANAHISMNFERRMRGIMLQRYLFSSLLSDTCDLVAWTKFTCTYVCICGSLLASGRDLSTSMLLFLDYVDCLLHFMLACSDVATADYLKSIL